MYILDNYVPIHQRLYVRQKDWVEFRDSESEMMVQMLLASDYKTSGKVLQNFLNLSHASRETYVLERAKTIIVVKDDKELKPLRRMIAGQSSELHSAVIKIAMTGCSLHQTLVGLACMVIQNEVESFPVVSTFSPPAPRLFTFVHDSEDYLPRVCSRYLEMCLAYITGDDCTDLCSNFPSRAERVSMYSEALLTFSKNFNEED